MLANVAVLQARLRQPDIAQPLQWGASPSPAPPPPPHGPPTKGSFVCRAARCFQVDGAGTFGNSSCLGRCEPLQTDEWLLLKAHWKIAAGHARAVSLYLPTPANKFLCRSRRQDT